MIVPAGIMMIEPVFEASREPVIDEATRKMTAAWRQATHSTYAYRAAPFFVRRGMHQCVCDAMSDNKDHWVLIDGEQKLTNSLAIHYLAYHRGDVPGHELAKVLQLPYGEADPTEDELKPPYSKPSSKGAWRGAE